MWKTVLYSWMSYTCWCIWGQFASVWLVFSFLVASILFLLFVIDRYLNSFNSCFRLLWQHCCFSSPWVVNSCATLPYLHMWETLWDSILRNGQSVPGISQGSGASAPKWIGGQGTQRKSVASSVLFLCEGNLGSKYGQNSLPTWNFMKARGSLLWFFYCVDTKCSFGIMKRLVRNQSSSAPAATSELGNSIIRELELFCFLTCCCQVVLMYTHVWEAAHMLWVT